MQNRFIPTLILFAYSALVIKLLVFKNVLLTLGPLMFRFTTDTGQTNFVPFKTILPYLLGEKGRMIALIELVGNIAPFVPIGFLVPFVYRKITWQKTLALAIASGLAIEGMQVIFRVGIFDIDDVILNGLGVMIGSWIFSIVFGSDNTALLRPINPKWQWIMALVGCLVVVSGGWIFTRPSVVPAAKLAADTLNGPAYSQAVNNFRPNQQGGDAQASDLCGGTGGIGEIISVGENTITIKRHKNGQTQIVNLTGQTTIKTPAGSASSSDLKIGDAVTLVGGPNPDGSFTADTVLVCGGRSTKTQSGGPDVSRQPDTTEAQRAPRVPPAQPQR